MPRPSQSRLNIRNTHAVASIQPKTTFTWTAQVQNPGPRTIHVSHRIQQVRVDAAQNLVEVSTAKPELADNVSVGFLSLPTTPVDPGQTVDLEFELPFPLRIARFAGNRAIAEVAEWMPAGPVEIRVNLAYGDQPFYPPSEPGKLNEALRRWTKIETSDPIRLPIGQSPTAR
jgi:hypothetical protein